MIPFTVCVRVMWLFSRDGRSCIDMGRIQQTGWNFKSVLRKSVRSQSGRDARSLGSCVSIPRRGWYGRILTIELTLVYESYPVGAPLMTYGVRDSGEILE